MRRRVLSLVVPLVFSGGLAMADGDAPVAPAAPPAAQAAAPHDVLVLKDGRRLEGEVVAEDESYVSLKSGGVTRAYARDSISSIEKAPRAPVQPGAAPGAAPSQPPAPSADSPKGKKAGKSDRRDAPLSDSAKKWLDDLLARSADADETVRRSIVAAVQALGPQAIPVIRAAQAAAPEGPQKQFLDKLAGDIEQRRDRAGPDGQGPGDGPGGRGGMARQFDEMIQRMSTELALTDEQKPKFEAVVRDMGKKRLEIRQARMREGLTQEQIAERVAALRADTLSQVKGVLTEPQYSMFEQQFAARLFEGPQRGPGANPPAPPKPAEPA
jgi:hypothetical protein